MTPKEKAKELYDKFQQYDWDEKYGFTPDKKGTKIYVNKIIDEIELQSTNWGVVSVTKYWIDVRSFLNAI